MVKNVRMRGDQQKSHVVQNHQKRDNSTSSLKIILISAIIILPAVIVFQELPKLYPTGGPNMNKAVRDSNHVQAKNKQENPADERQLEDIPDEVKNFQPTLQTNFTTKKIFFEGRRIAPIELLPEKNVSTDHSVRVFLFDDFLSADECDKLRAVHDKHVRTLSDQPPILCFDSTDTLKKHMKSAGKQKIRVSKDDFTEGTWCLNDTFSAEVAGWLKYNWSYSTAFYPGESQFSNKMGALIQETTGLKKENGGKFQITSYPLNIGYKTHTDCTEQQADKRDRVGTILIYLDDVADGGETSFPELGIWVKPRKGRAVVWNNMDTSGSCDPMSIHQANKVITGHKYILQRWYYYENFWSLGKRPPPPPLPQQSYLQHAMVSCDEYQYGSCRWYDEWSHDILVNYRNHKTTFI